MKINRLFEKGKFTLDCTFEYDSPEDGVGPACAILECWICVPITGSVERFPAVELCSLEADKAFPDFDALFDHLCGEVIDNPPGEPDL